MDQSDAGNAGNGTSFYGSSCCAGNGKGTLDTPERCGARRGVGGGFRRVGSGRKSKGRRRVA
eukprot:2962915-Pyramimonas_sp.AAC.1